MEAYRECLVKRERTSKDRGIEVALLLGGVAFCFIALFVTSLAFLGAAVLEILWYFRMFYNNVEYEYTLVDGTIAIDTIYNKKKRKKMGEYDLKKVLAAAETKDERLERLRGDGTKLEDYSSHAETGRTVSLFVKGDKGDRVEIRISPDETMFKLIWQQLPMLAKRLDMI